MIRLNEAGDKPLLQVIVLVLHTRCDSKMFWEASLFLRLSDTCFYSARTPAVVGYERLQKSPPRKVSIIWLIPTLCVPSDLGLGSIHVPGLGIDLLDPLPHFVLPHPRSAFTISSSDVSLTPEKTFPFESIYCMNSWRMHPNPQTWLRLKVRAKQHFQPLNMDVGLK